MRRYLQRFAEAFRKGDLILLLLCVVTTAFGCLMIASTTNASDNGPWRFVIIQIIAAAAGIFAYVVISSIDAETFSEHRTTLVLFNTVLLLLIIPFGTDNGSGNKSWLNFPFLPFDIQPAEVCKITYVLIMASVMASHQNKLSAVPSVMHMALHLILLMGLNMLVSRDLGVSLIFVFIFVKTVLLLQTHSLACSVLMKQNLQKKQHLCSPLQMKSAFSVLKMFHTEITLFVNLNLLLHLF